MEGMIYSLTAGHEIFTFSINNLKQYTVSKAFSDRATLVEANCSNFSYHYFALSLVQININKLD